MLKMTAVSFLFSAFMLVVGGLHLKMICFECGFLPGLAGGLHLEAGD